MKRFGVQRKLVGKKPEFMLIGNNGSVLWSTDQKNATTWWSEQKAENVMRAQTKAPAKDEETGEVEPGDAAEVFSIDDGAK